MVPHFYKYLQEGLVFCFALYHVPKFSSFDKSTLKIQDLSVIVIYTNLFEISSYKPMIDAGTQIINACSYSLTRAF